MNVLVYSGPGATKEATKHCFESLRVQLLPHYAVVPVTSQALINDPWQSKTALLVMPGGMDLPFCKELNGEGNRRISKWVRAGGKYLGFCAGGYYAASRVEFMVGSAMEVLGPRELQFFDGIARGTAFPGFNYESSEGALACRVQTNEGETAHFYHGGAVFVDAENVGGVEVLARYMDPVSVAGGDAAIVLCTVGNGKALLTGTHPEFCAWHLKPQAGQAPSDVVDTLKANEPQRLLFLRNSLLKLGLRVNPEPQTVAAVTPVYVTSNCDGATRLLYEKIKHDAEIVNLCYLEDANDTFRVVRQLLDINVPHGDAVGSVESAESAVKELCFLDAIPPKTLTPSFDLSMYYAHLQRLAQGKRTTFGNTLAYGEVVTSTNTLLDRNPQLLLLMPQGFAITAGTQVAGRGRGGNAWVNPRGVMAALVVVRVEGTHSAVLFQYLAGLALVELILQYDSVQPGAGMGYEELPVRIKWPNDLYILKPEHFDDDDNTNATTENDEQRYAKVSGALVNTQFVAGKMTLVWGGGVNVDNPAPTTSLNQVLAKLNEHRGKRGQQPLPPYHIEKLLAQYLYTLDGFFQVFSHSGLRPFLPLYYKRWLHSDQKVTVIQDGERRQCVIKGITPEYGLLVAEDIKTRESLELQPDGNSFDIFKGLVYKKR